MLQNQRVIQSLEDLERYLGATRSRDLNLLWSGAVNYRPQMMVNAPP